MRPLLRADTGRTRLVLVLGVAVSVLAAGLASHVLHGRYGQYVLDRLPVTTATRRLAYHTPRLHALAYEPAYSRSGLDSLGAAVTILEATAHAARRLRLGEDTLPSLVGDDLATYAAASADDLLDQLLTGIAALTAGMAALTPARTDTDDDPPGFADRTNTGTTTLLADLFAVPRA